MPPPGSIYLIVEGVRRSVAAREAGLTTFPAVLDIDGKLGPPFDVPLGELHSTKPSVPRVGDEGRYARIEQAMADPQTRAGLPMIVVRLVPAKFARYFVRLEDVTLES